MLALTLRRAPRVVITSTWRPKRGIWSGGGVEEAGLREAKPAPERAQRIVRLLASQLWPPVDETKQDSSITTGKRISTETAQNIRNRVALSASLLVGAKALTIGTPFLFKEAIDVLSVNDAIVAAPVAVLTG